MLKKVYCVTVDPTTWSDEIWPKVAELCDLASDVTGDQWDLGTTWQVWVATTDEKMANIVMEKLLEKYPELDNYLAIEEVEHELKYSPLLGEHEVVESVMTLKEAAEKWGIKENSLRSALIRGKMFEEQKQQGLVRQSGATWLIHKEAMWQVYGQPVPLTGNTLLQIKNKEEMKNETKNP